MRELERDREREYKRESIRERERERKIEQDLLGQVSRLRKREGQKICKFLWQKLKKKCKIEKHIMNNFITLLEQF